MNHKSFINDRPLIFENIYNPVIETPLGFSILSESEYNLDKVLDEIQKLETAGIVYLCADPDQAWNNFTARYILMEAAGGLVKNPKNEYLIIFRKKMWDLPKGKLEYRESPEDGAIREVTEECGVNDLQLGKFLLKTFHTYTEKNKFILKKTHWFAMTSNGDGELTPQIEEGIDKVRWMDREKIREKVFPKTYSSIIDVLLEGLSETENRNDQPTPGGTNAETSP